MLIIDDRNLPNKIGRLEIVNRVGRRMITDVIHDIDGTHSLIRDWPPVMSRCLYYALSEGLPEGYDSDENVEQISELAGSKELPETDRFCVESAGLSAITQMEWAIRRSIEEGTIKVPGLNDDGEEMKANSEIIKMIWAGEERFPFEESEAMTSYLKEHTPRLFKLYELVLYRSSRDKNLKESMTHPEKWRVRGSVEFISALHQLGVRNYFVTGAVVQEDEKGKINGGIYEEVVTLGFEIGDGKIIDAIYGSRWDKKMPKSEVTRELCKKLEIDPERLMIIGDGRTEIQIGAEIGAVTMSRLPEEATRMRDIHRELGTNYIVPDYREGELSKLFGNLVEVWDSEVVEA